jgi:hypothetical protein
MIPLLRTTEALRRDGVGRGRPDFRANPPAAPEKQETLALRDGSLNPRHSRRRRRSGAQAINDV